MAIYFAIDTNAFIHFKLFTEIDWTKIFQTDDLTMLVTKTIVRELDDKKNHPDRFLSNKAKSVIKKLEACVNNDHFICHGKVIPIVVHRPVTPTEYYTQHDLSETSADDRFLAEVKLFRQAHKDDRVIVVSGDLGMRMKTEWLDVEYLKLEEELRQKNEDPIAKENETLKRELQRIQSAKPNLKLTFENDELLLRVVRPRLTVLSEEDIRLLVQQEHEQFYELDASDKPRNANLPRIMGFREPDIDTYKKQWKVYIEELPENIKAINRQEIEVHGSLKLLLWLNNTGGAPAQSSGIHILAPEGMSFVDEDDFKESVEPRKLDRPTLNYDTGSRTGIGRPFATEALLAHYSRSIMPPDMVAKINQISQPMRPYWRIAGNSAEIELGELRNRYHKRLPAIFIRMDEIQPLSSFNINYNIEAGLVDGFSGRLNIIVEEDI